MTFFWVSFDGSCDLIFGYMIRGRFFISEISDWAGIWCIGGLFSLVEVAMVWRCSTGLCIRVAGCIHRRRFCVLSVSCSVGVKFCCCRDNVVFLCWWPLNLYCWLNGLYTVFSSYYFWLSGYLINRRPGTSGCRCNGMTAFAWDGVCIEEPLFNLFCFFWYGCIVSFSVVLFGILRFLVFFRRLRCNFWFWCSRSSLWFWVF